MSNIPLNKSTLKLSLPANNIDADIYLALNTMANTKKQNPYMNFLHINQILLSFSQQTIVKNQSSG